MKHDRQKEKMRPVYEACQSDNESWEHSDDEINRAIDTVTIESFNSIHCIIVTRLKTSSSQKPHHWNTKHVQRAIHKNSNGKTSQLFKKLYYMHILTYAFLN